MELAPWYPTQLELKPTASYVHRTSRNIARKNHTVFAPLHGNFYNFTALMPVFSYCGEAGLLFSNSSKRSFGIDNFSITGRYQLMDDSALVDPFSLVIGTTFVFASKAALNDLNSFHHGRFETLFHASFGKEWPSENPWLYRMWGNTLFGMADVGSPWWQGRLAFEYEREDIDRISFFVCGLKGLGRRSLNPHCPFHGYGPIDHRSIDLSICYTRFLKCGSELSISIRRNVYAYNFPRNTTYYCCSLSYPFGF